MQIVIQKEGEREKDGERDTGSQIDRHRLEEQLNSDNRDDNDVGMLALPWKHRTKPNWQNSG